MRVLRRLEASLDDLLVKRAPALPASAKKALVSYLPWINLALGVLALSTLYLIWQRSHPVGYTVSYGGAASFDIKLGLAVMAAEVVLYLAAFHMTLRREKAGWNLMLYATMINVIYGVAIAFTPYGNIVTLMAAVISTLAGLYLLFQIRSSYHKPPAPARAKATAKTKAKPKKAKSKKSKR